MDQRLGQRLKKWNEYLGDVQSLEAIYLELSAHEKILYSKMFLETKGNVEERKAQVYSSTGWRDFVLGLVEAEAKYLDGKRRLEVLVKAYEAEYLTFKLEAQAIRAPQ